MLGRRPLPDVGLDRAVGALPGTGLGRGPGPGGGEVLAP